MVCKTVMEIDWNSYEGKRLVESLGVIISGGLFVLGVIIFGLVTIVYCCCTSRDKSRKENSIWCLYKTSRCIVTTFWSTVVEEKVLEVNENGGTSTQRRTMKRLTLFGSVREPTGCSGCCIYFYLVVMLVLTASLAALLFWETLWFSKTTTCLDPDVKNSDSFVCFDLNNTAQPYDCHNYSEGTNVVCYQLLGLRGLKAFSTAAGLYLGITHALSITFRFFVWAGRCVGKFKREDKNKRKGCCCFGIILLQSFVAVVFLVIFVLFLVERLWDKAGSREYLNILQGDFVLRWFAFVVTVVTFVFGAIFFPWCIFKDIKYKDKYQILVKLEDPEIGYIDDEISLSPRPPGERTPVSATTRASE